MGVIRTVSGCFVGTIAEPQVAHQQSSSQVRKKSSPLEALTCLRSSSQAAYSQLHKKVSGCESDTFVRSSSQITGGSEAPSAPLPALGAVVNPFTPFGNLPESRSLVFGLVNRHLLGKLIEDDPNIDGSLSIDLEKHGLQPDGISLWDCCFLSSVGSECLQALGVRSAREWRRLALSDPSLMSAMKSAVAAAAALISGEAWTTTIECTAPNFKLGPNVISLSPCLAGRTGGLAIAGFRLLVVPSGNQKDRSFRFRSLTKGPGASCLTKSATSVSSSTRTTPNANVWGKSQSGSGDSTPKRFHMKPATMMTLSPNRLAESLACAPVVERGVGSLAAAAGAHKGAVPSCFVEAANAPPEVVAIQQNEDLMWKIAAGALSEAVTIVQMSSGTVVLQNPESMKYYGRLCGNPCRARKTNNLSGGRRVFSEGGAGTEAGSEAGRRHKVPEVLQHLFKLQPELLPGAVESVFRGAPWGKVLRVPQPKLETTEERGESEESEESEEMVEREEMEDESGTSFDLEMTSQGSLFGGLFDACPNDEETQLATDASIPILSMQGLVRNSQKAPRDSGSVIADLCSSISEVRLQRGISAPLEPGPRSTSAKVKSSSNDTLHRIPMGSRRSCGLTELLGSRISSEVQSICLSGASSNIHSGHLRRSSLLAPYVQPTLGRQSVQGSRARAASADGVLPTDSIGIAEMQLEGQIAEGGLGCDESHVNSEGLQLWKEVNLVPVTMSSGDKVLVIVQKDISSQVELAMQLANSTEILMDMLKNMFPRHVLEYLIKQPVNQPQYSLDSLGRCYDGVSIMFMDIMGFTTLSREVSAPQVMSFLNELFTKFDHLVDLYQVYKVETAGDCYIVAGGLTTKDKDGLSTLVDEVDPREGAMRVAAFAWAILQAAETVPMPHNGKPTKVRIGVHSGAVTAGVIGTKLPKFSLFGDTMNTASRMESTCPTNNIQISQATFDLLSTPPSNFHLDSYSSSDTREQLDIEFVGTQHLHGPYLTQKNFKPRGPIEIKGKGVMETFVCDPADTCNTIARVESHNSCADALSTRASGFQTLTCRLNKICGKMNTPEVLLGRRNSVDLVPMLMSQAGLADLSTMSQAGLTEVSTGGHPSLEMADSRGSPVSGSNLNRSMSEKYSSRIHLPRRASAGALTELAPHQET